MSCSIAHADKDLCLPHFDPLPTIPTVYGEPGNVRETVSRVKQKVRVAAVCRISGSVRLLYRLLIRSSQAWALARLGLRHVCFYLTSGACGQVAGGEDSEGGRYGSTDEMWKSELGKADPKSTEGWYGKGVKYWEVRLRTRRAPADSPHAWATPCAGRVISRGRRGAIGRCTWSQKNTRSICTVAAREEVDAGA